MAATEKKVKKKKKLGSYPFASVVFSIFITLLVMGIFGFLILNATVLKKTIREKIEMQVYLKKSAGPSDLTKLQKTLSDKPYTLRKDQIPQLRTIDKDEAAKEYSEKLGEDFVEFLGANPLRDLIVIKLSEPYHRADSLQKIRKEISAYGSVFEVEYQEDLIKGINDNITVITLFLVGFAVILFLAAVILINNTIKLALFSQRFLIRSMQLVGATSSFIQKPFLKRAVWYGFLAGMLASVVILALVYYLNSIIEGLENLQTTENIVILVSAVVLLGMLVSFGSSYQAIKKYMKLSLDELY